MTSMEDQLVSILDGTEDVEGQDGGPEEVVIHPFTIITEYARNLVPGIDVDDRGLDLPGGVTIEQVMNLAELFESAHASIPLLWGDLINQAERDFRTEWTQVLSDRLGRAEGTVRNWRFITANIPRDIRPDPRVVRISKLYHIAGLFTLSAKRFFVELAAAEGLDTNQVKEVCDLVKTYPEEEREDWEDFWVTHATKTGPDFQELCQQLRADLIARGYIEDPYAEDQEDTDATQKAQKTGEETAEDLVSKLLELAAEAGLNVPQNVLALFASGINLAKVIAFSQKAEAVQDAFTTMGLVMDHLVQLRLAQIEQGRPDVGCICDLDDMNGLTQWADCPVHGHSSEIEPEEEDGE